MVMNMHKYDHTKGSKAFSYFSVVAKNYLILHNNNNYKKLKTHDDFESDGDDYYSTRQGEGVDDTWDERSRLGSPPRMGPIARGGTHCFKLHCLSQDATLNEK